MKKTIMCDYMTQKQLKSNVFVDNNYVYKYYDDEKVFDKNLNISRQFSKLSLGPDVVDAYSCMTLSGMIRYTIVYEKLNKTMADIIEENDGNIPKKYINQLVELLLNAYQNGLYYNDLWDDNLMINSEGKLYFIDINDAEIGKKLSLKNAIDKTVWKLYADPTFDTYLRRTKGKNAKKYTKVIEDYLRRTKRYFPDYKTKQQLKLLTTKKNQKMSEVNRLLNTRPIIKRLKGNTDEIDALIKEVEMSIVDIQNEINALKVGNGKSVKKTKKIFDTGNIVGSASSRRSRRVSVGEGRREIQQTKVLSPLSGIVKPKSKRRGYYTKSRRKSGRVATRSRRR